MGNNQKSNLYVLLLTGLFFYISITYNACSEVKFQQTSELSEKIKTESIVINNGDKYTVDNNVNLTLFSPFASHMLISNVEDCSVGSWEPYTESKTWSLSKENDTVAVYVMYRVDGDNTACAKDDIVHDNIPPAITFLNSQDMYTTTNADSIRFDVSDSGSGVDQIKCSLNVNAPFSTCSTTISLQMLTEGQHSLFVIATDKAGNTTSPEDFRWTVDTGKPVVVLNKTPLKLDNSTTAEFEFTATDGVSGVDKIYCKIDNGDFSECTSPFTRSGLSETSHIFYVKAVDKAGNESDTVQYDWVIDATAPVISITKHPSAITHDNFADFEFDGTDNGSPITEFECKLEFQTFESCSSPISYSNLGEGNHTFYVRGKDDAGNFSAAASYTWVIDNTPPIITFVQHPNAVTNSQNATFQMDAQDTNGSGINRIECKLDSGEYATCLSLHLLSDLTKGSHTFVARSVDNAGNISQPISYTWVIDLDKPIVSITSAPDTNTQDVNATFTFTATDVGAGIDYYHCKLDGGSYEICVSPKDYFSLGEGGHIFYVRAIDKAGNVSDPVSHNWKIDNTLPVITFIKQPDKLFEGDDAIVYFIVTDTNSGLDTNTCYLDAVVNPTCQADFELVYPNQALGVHTYRVVVTDKAGNSAAKEISWEVDYLTKDYSDSLQISKNFKTDILFVVDSSGSMQEEMRELANRIDGFLDKIINLDWQISIATVDPQASRNDGDGQLINIAGGTGKIIYKNDANALKLLSDTITTSTNGSGKEQGIRAVYRSIERFEDPIAENDYHRMFYRDDAHLAVILISDEDEKSNGTSLEEINMPENLINKVKAKWPNKNFIFNSIIWNPADSQEVCSTASHKGVIYAELSELTNGVIGSVCAYDYTETVSDLGDRVVRLQNSIFLKCEPIDADKDGNLDINVLYKATANDPLVEYNAPFSVFGQKIEFSDGLIEGEYVVNYTCHNKL